MLLREGFISLSVDLTFGSGTCVIRINRASILKKAVRKKRKGTPNFPASTGDMARLSAKVRPMEAPIWAKALVLTSSLVRSADRAIMAEETAPNP